ncbi:hypothetical protein AURDEDRAFT_178733 [Auricularia subglabra TFB-10046 SS5]|uniref:RING-type domain-containing protein n=1 Tax=Auricularia subglabra (strain TFB-10046 / SS5) TaxID=717982 RepID=J0D0Z2_AURST|nr:hypothetical protein AURDEDRAFT_178733 [Auricularia subglabra TFB-10046 SS5]
MSDDHGITATPPQSIPVSHADIDVAALIVERDAAVAASLRHTAMLVAAETRGAKARNDLAKAHDAISKLTAKVQTTQDACDCFLCLDTCWVPWILSDCGHAMCQACLLSFLSCMKVDARTHSPTVAYTTCPRCNTEILSRPVQAFDMSSLINEICSPKALEALPHKVKRAFLQWKHTRATFEQARRNYSLEIITALRGLGSTATLDAHELATASDYFNFIASLDTIDNAAVVNDDNEVVLAANPATPAASNADGLDAPDAPVIVVVPVARNLNGDAAPSAGAHHDDDDNPNLALNLLAIL